MVIAKILSSLPERFDNVRTAWYAIPQALQTLDKLNEHLVNEEALLDMHKESATASNNQEVYYAGGKRNYGKGSKKPRGSQANDNVKRGNCHYLRNRVTGRVTVRRKSLIWRKRLLSKITL